MMGESIRQIWVKHKDTFYFQDKKKKQKAQGGNKKPPSGGLKAENTAPQTTDSGGLKDPLNDLSEREILGDSFK